MARLRLSGRVGAALDPCAAIQVSFELAAGRNGKSSSGSASGGTPRTLAIWCVASGDLRGAQRARRGLAILAAYAGVVNVETPDQSLNMLTNAALVPDAGMPPVGAQRLLPVRRRLRFSAISCRRDGAHPHRAAPRTRAPPPCRRPSIPEGDVQHWWHPPQGRGVRTHCSDDYLWLPCDVPLRPEYRGLQRMG